MSGAGTESVSEWLNWVSRIRLSACSRILVLWAVRQLRSLHANGEDHGKGSDCSGVRWLRKNAMDRTVCRIMSHLSESCQRVSDVILA